jgi:hypothetical protein
MRTKTLALSALLGMIGAASALAQTNVYSVNAVGYINMTFPANSYSIVTCPLVCSPDNTLNTVLNDTNGQYKKAKVYAFAGGAYTSTETGVGTGANASGWSGGGADITLNPGVAAFFYNSTAAAMTATFVGTVPQNGAYNMTNSLIPGWNLVGSIVPAAGDLSTNPITSLTNINNKDFVYTYDPTNGGYSGRDTVVGSLAGHGYNNRWSGGDPIIDQVGYGFFYWNNQSTNNPWVENFSINP